ncbi:hypothetical protein MPTK1_6g03200 [Marchantia polymorpha subsp. ruderalis]|uniref:Uncharacterized protein n=2 Tax=Marchantia polymorpha TaxID=3197 RepID=A0A176WDV5_MARPO|nr:hypothetical protein AXG93_4031s1470 [Marchantia polymorpha subsp. ruderalis]PTQ41326.1 hypothetical protein MARPO_0035s0100 [Marchantia polymorpha]BBN13405.1 hypothetical protein Mp_6g03200 [Marchantia polymorpha subsp. ruderalis]|eukprot:PTQ41326.1 hypothetical protein MARPO_0035s0100 [Marchantia polymorpha]
MAVAASCIQVLSIAGVQGLSTKFALRKNKDQQSLTARCALEEFPFGDGPIEPTRPKFSRDPHTDLSFIAVSDPAAAPLEPKKIKIGRPRRNRPWKKATPAQAIVGSIVGGFWAVLAQKATTIGYEHLQGHPVAHDLPMGLTTSVNSLFVSAVIGFGGFASCMFGVSSFGLALLALKLLTAPKPPVQ